MAASRRDSRERRDAASTVRGVSPVRVLLVDDHQMLTEALAARLSTTPDIVVAGHCAARDPHPEVLVTAARPDVIAIEVTLARDATPLLALFRTAWPPAHFVVLTASRDPEQAVETARAQRRDGPLDSLTCRERAVLMRLVEGCRQAEIAEARVVGEHGTDPHQQDLRQARRVQPAGGRHGRAKCRLVWLSRIAGAAG